MRRREPELDELARLIRFVRAKGSMDTPDSKVHSFIVKVWLEDADEKGSTVWHGHITHVPDGERRYLHSLRDILSFVEPYLANLDLGVPQNPPERSWLKPWARRK